MENIRRMRAGNKRMKRSRRGPRKTAPFGTTRRILLAALFLLLLCLNVSAEAPLPILFVHGNGDSAALWYTTLSIGLPAEMWRKMRSEYVNCRAAHAYQ